jgi:4-carboxymuconolactone decarboxylase
MARSSGREPEALADERIRRRRSNPNTRRHDRSRTELVAPVSLSGGESNLPPRIEPLDEGSRSSRQAEVIADLVVGPTVNIYTTLARAPELALAMVRLGRELRAGGIPGRHREILILRTGWNCGSGYELAQHRRVALEIGMDEGDLRRIRIGPDAPGWEPFEAQLCRAADELHGTNDISDATWSALAERYDEAQLIQATMVVGYYHLVSFALNTLRVPLESWTVPMPDDG